jgi:hypothetical protein
VPYKLAIGKIINGLPSESSSTIYGPVTWTEDRSWGYRTPIYMLNCIIRLQAIVEIITNETARALNSLAKQSTKMHNAIYQNCLALDNLLASREEFVENLTQAAAAYRLMMKERS